MSAPTPLTEEQLRAQLLRVVAQERSWATTTTLQCGLGSGEPRVRVVAMLDKLKVEGVIEHKRSHASDYWRHAQAQDEPRPARGATGAQRTAIADLLGSEPDLTIAEIASRLGLARPTVKYHVRMIRSELAQAGAAPIAEGQLGAALHRKQQMTQPHGARYAIWNTGELVIAKGEIEIRLGAIDVQTLRSFIAHMPAAPAGALA
ncbi:winged helix-turn-helix domain-containing protein [Solimonas flava]|uniref:winged helix-turn-helix domain-containing protein n=1 Tax=Solimonas flava TaxID=415849 RepID=UPI0004184690|nr:winged helix-turn-helix domain-containing protein [Solimonas flava]